METLAQAEAAGIAIAQSAPHVSGSALDDLRRLPATELLRIAVAHGPYAGPPIVDGWVIPQPPASAFAAGAAQKVDLLAGLNGRELSAFRMMAAATTRQQDKPQTGSGGASEAVKKLAATAHPLYGAWTYAAIAKYLGQAIFHRDEAVDQGSNDMLMACPTGALATLTGAAGAKVFVYRFDRSIPGKGESSLGAFHGLEIPYVFSALGDPSWSWLPFTGADAKLASTMQTYWTNFARSGDPNSADVPGWPGWRDGDEAYMDFSPDATSVARHSFSPSFCYLSVDRLRKSLSGAR
jgi:para-nitrobenzyl esterase